MPHPALGLITAGIDRNDTIGGALLVMALIFALLAYALSKEGFKADELHAAAQAADQAKDAVSQVQTTMAQAQAQVAQMTGSAPEQVATSSKAAAAVLPSIYDEISNVSKAVDKLTGNQVPAGVPWSLCVLCLVAAFASFGLIAADLGSSASSPPATTTTATTP